MKEKIEQISSSIYFSTFIILAVLVFTIFIFNKGQIKPEGESLPASVGKILKASPDHILIKFKSDTQSVRNEQVKSKYKLREDSEIHNIGVKIISISSDKAPESLVAELNRNESDAIEFAEPDYVVEPSVLPNDPWFTNWQKDKQQMNVPEAWDTISTSGFILAVADTGVNCAHEDLSSQCVIGWNFYDNNSDTSDVYGHGTAVAGVASALGNNNVGVAGNIWQSNIMPLRVSAPDGTATYSNIASAITYAADRGAKVVNASYQIGGSATIARAASYLKSHGGLLVASEGNYGSKTGYKNNPDIVSVSAVDASDLKYSWSSFGADVDVSAPGCTGATTLRDGSYGAFCGTSNSAPEVAGVLMLIWSANPTLTPDQVQDVLFKSADDLGSNGRDDIYGWGRINAASAVNMATSYVGNPIPIPIKIPNPLKRGQN